MLIILNFRATWTRIFVRLSNICLHYVLRNALLKRMLYVLNQLHAIVFSMSVRARVVPTFFPMRIIRLCMRVYMDAFAGNYRTFFFHYNLMQISINIYDLTHARENIHCAFISILCTCVCVCTRVLTCTLTCLLRRGGG